MGITYLKLRELLLERDMPLKELKILTKINNNTLAKIYKDEHMSTVSIEKIARALGVEIGDIISLKP
jgi:DNA-binding Xre family transcriptional regulator